MTQQEYENEVKKFYEQLWQKLEEEEIEAEQPKRWKPEYDETYWLVDYNGNICNADWGNDPADEWVYLTGNCFKAKEEAEEYKKQIEYTARYKNYIEEHSEPIDWSNERQKKYYARFDCFTNEIEVDWYGILKHQGVIYASSEQIIWDAIKEIGEDNFKKYVLGVK